MLSAKVSNGTNKFVNKVRMMLLIILLNLWLFRLLLSRVANTRRIA